MPVRAGRGKAGSRQDTGERGEERVIYRLFQV